MIVDFRKRVQIISSYVDTNFFDSQSICIIARGPSLARMDIYKDKFDHCFLAGEFNNTFDYIGGYLFGKDIVLVSMKPERYRTSPENCRKYNIKNIQVSVRFNTDEFYKIKRFYPDLKVTGYTNDHCILNERVFGDNKIYSTGMAAIFHSLYFNPKNIYIIGVDFYDGSQNFHFIKEKMDQKEEEKHTSILVLRQGMIENLVTMCDLFPKINFHLLTTFRGILSRKNLEINYV